MEKIRDSATVGFVMLLKVSETDADLIDRAEIEALLVASNTESNATNYARKTGLTLSITVDNTNNRVDADCPDQTWSSLGGATNNTLTDALVCYEEAGADATRIPLSLHDFALTTTGNDVTIQFNASGFGRAA